MVIHNTEKDNHKHSGWQDQYLCFWYRLKIGEMLVNISKLKKTRLNSLIDMIASNDSWRDSNIIYLITTIWRCYCILKITEFYKGHWPCEYHWFLLHVEFKNLLGIHKKNFVSNYDTVTHSEDKNKFGSNFHW